MSYSGSREGFKALQTPNLRPVIFRLFLGR